MSKALDGVKILDFTHVQSGPTCTQLLAWFGADVIKVEKAGDGDATRGQLRDIEGVDSLYFTMLNHNKRSITLDTKNPKGKEVLVTLIKQCDVLVENFAPGALDRMGFTWERIQEINPRMIVASVKGFGPGPYEDCKVYENVAQCAGGSASTTGFDDGPPLVTGAQIGDSGTGLHLAVGLLAALHQARRTGEGQYVEVAMMDGVMNLCRVKFRDHQRLTRQDLSEYSVPTYTGMGDVPRAGNDSGGGQLGNAIHCKPHGSNDWLYVVVQEAVWDSLSRRIGPDVHMPDLVNDPRLHTIGERRKNQALLWTLLNKFAENYTKRELMAVLNDIDVPCGPIMSTQDLATDEHVRGRQMYVELDHPQRGAWYNVGMPIKLSASPATIKRSPLLGEHTDEVLRDVLGYDEAKVASLKTAGAFSNPPKAKA